MNSKNNFKIGRGKHLIQNNTIFPKKPKDLVILRQINAVLSSENVHLDDIYKGSMKLSYFKYSPIALVFVE